MSATASALSASIPGFDLRPCRRPSASLAGPSGRLQFMALKQGDWYVASPRVRQQLGRSAARKPRTKLRVVMDGSILPGASPPPPSNFPVWVTWVLGSLVAIIIPVLKLKGGFFVNFGKRIDQVVDSVEDVAEALEDAAEAVENAASDVADHLPAGEIKDAALWIENASKEVKEDAGKTKDFMNMVDDFTEKVEENAETIMDSISEKKEEEGVVLQTEAQTEGQAQQENKATMATVGKKEKVETVTAQTLGQEAKGAREKAQPVKDAVEVRQS